MVPKVARIDLINKLKQQLSSQFVRNMGWLGGAEILSRLFRIATTITLARILSEYEYGLIAIILIAHEFATIFVLKSGIGSKIIQAEEKDVEVLCNTAYWLNWILCASIFVIQCAAAFPVAWFYGDNRVILPICTIASSYLIMPIFATQSALIQRENRLKIIAICNLVQMISGGILNIILALLGFGIWSVVLPFVLTVPVWIVITLKNHPWRPTVPFTLYRWREIIGFSISIIAVEFLNKVRANIDYMIVGRFLGVNALGIYYFAFTAGLNISLSVINVFVMSLFPHLCSARTNIKELKSRYYGSFTTIAIIIIPLVLLQSGLATFYVPLIFGQKWIAAIPVLMLICLSSIPRPFAEAANQLLLAVEKNHIALYWNLIFTVLFTLSILVVVKDGVIWVAASVLITHVVALPIFTLWANRYVLAKR